MTAENTLNHRYDFALFFDVINGNPNGDPDAGNMPRIDPETGKGLVSDVCLKRKIRNYVDLAKSNEEGFRIYVEEGSILNEKHREAYKHLGINDDKKEKLTPKDNETIQLRSFMCQNFFDVRSFGAVMSTDINCGQVRGPVQLAFARSVDPIFPLEITVTRMAATNKKEKAKQSEGSDEKRTENRTMGRKYIVPYGLYRAHGFISAKLAEKTGFSDTDLAVLIEALQNMFEHDHSAARGEMTVRKLIMFKHESALGNAPAHKLFDLIKTERTTAGQETPPRSFTDYKITLPEKVALPAGVEMKVYD